MCIRDRGFKRTEWHDVVCENQYGYGGFYLIKYLSKKIFIEADWLSLDKPQLWYKSKEDVDTERSIYLSFEQVKELLSTKSLK